MRRRILIIHNPQAGLRQRQFLSDVCRRIEYAGTTVRVENAETIQQDQEVARSAGEAGDFDVVVAAGGDSTIRGVACGLIGSSMPLGIIPIGTGNVLAKEIGLGRDPSDVADTLLHGSSIKIRYGRADARPFLVMAGAGFDAHVVESLNTSWKRSVGKLAYTWPIVREIFRKPERFEVAIDGRVFFATWLVVTRVSHYGGSFIIADRQTLLDDGFHAIITTAESTRALAGVLVSLASGHHAVRRDVTVVACKHVRFPDGHAIAMQLDGERVMPSPRELTLSDDRLTIIVPRASPLVVTEPS